MANQTNLKSFFQQSSLIINQMKLSIFLMFAALLTLGFTSYYTFINNNILASYKTNKINENNQVKSNLNEVQSNNKVAALGYIQTKEDPIKLSAPAFLEGARVEELLVKLRDQVKANQVVAILDNRDRLEAALNQAQKQVQVSQALLDQVRAGAKQGEIQSQKARFRATQAELTGQIETQKATIANLKAQLAGQTNAIEAEIARLKAEVKNATKECQRYTELEAGGAVSDSQKDNICLQQETTEKQLTEAEVNLQRVTNTLQAQINEAQANLNRTVNTLDQQITEAQASLNAVAEVRGVDVQVALSELETAQSNVKKAQAELDLAYVRSPIDGQILKINTWPGEIVNSAEGIVVLGDTTMMFVVAEVYETEINKIKIGQKATISSSGITKDLTGIVEEIGLQIGTKDVLGTDPVADADARVVEVKIRLNPEDSKIVADLTNLQVNVIIDTNNS